MKAFRHSYVQKAILGERKNLFVFTKRKRDKDVFLFESKQKKNSAPERKETGHKMFDVDRKKKRWGKKNLFDQKEEKIILIMKMQKWNTVKQSEKSLFD